MGEDLKNMDATERLLVQRIIAGIIDSPSVYMGGPRHQAMKKAERIIQQLEIGDRLFSTVCDHHAWMTFRMHGIYCPDCYTIIKTKKELDEGLARENADRNSAEPERE